MIFFFFFSSSLSQPVIKYPVAFAVLNGPALPMKSVFPMAELTNVFADVVMFVTKMVKLAEMSTSALNYPVHHVA